jgi:hypothetical protein
LSSILSLLFDVLEFVVPNALLALCVHIFLELLISAEWLGSGEIIAWIFQIYIRE